MKPYLENSLLQLDQMRGLSAGTIGFPTGSAMTNEYGPWAQSYRRTNTSRQKASHLGTLAALRFRVENPVKFNWTFERS